MRGSTNVFIEIKPSKQLLMRGYTILFIEIKPSNVTGIYRTIRYGLLTSKYIKLIDLLSLSKQCFIYMYIYFDSNPSECL